jgi:hypothetical protein
MPAPKKGPRFGRDPKHQRLIMANLHRFSAHVQRRLAGPCRHLLRRAGPQLGETLNQRMAHIGAGRAAEFGVGCRLERQQRQHMVDIGAHGPRPAGPPQHA